MLAHAQSLGTTLTRLLGEAGVGGMMSASSTASRMRPQGNTRMRIFARDQHGRQVRHGHLLAFVYMCVYSCAPVSALCSAGLAAA